MKYCLSTALMVILMLTCFSQQKKHWSTEDRKYLIENLKRTRDSVIKETKGLSKDQWDFKESSDRWSINQIVEHLAIWELLLQREITFGFTAGERPELIDSARSDSAVVAFLMEDNPHIATEYTKPFTYTVPMGINEGTNNLAWFLKMRNESIGFVDTTKSNLRVYFLRPKRNSVYQVFITIFAHTDRHLRQIKRVKSDANYPKK